VSVWIVREFAEIEGMIEELEGRAMALSMKLMGAARGIDESAKPSKLVPDSVKRDTELLTAVAGDAIGLHDELGVARRAAAAAVKRSAGLILEPDA
jgi:hypothetical protein